MLEEEKIQKINTIHKEIDSGSYASQNRVCSDKYSSNIEYHVDQVLARKHISSYEKKRKTHDSLDKRLRKRYTRRLYRSVKRFPVKEVLLAIVAIMALLIGFP